MSEGLNRFIKAQKYDYPVALEEIRSGHKRNHWIWYIFPQLKGLGQSYNSDYYGIADIDEARAYLADEILGSRLREISESLMALNDDDPLSVMGSPDDLKLRSCMTLFAQISEEGSVFHRVLDKFFGGGKDTRTIAILEGSA